METEPLKLAAQDAVKENKSKEQFLRTIAPSYRDMAGRFFDDAEQEQARQGETRLTYNAVQSELDRIEHAKRLKARSGNAFRPSTGV